ncbi:MAG: FeoB-associated Cys-rich membrane protein [Clostridia bacterium]|nr:FeoB-associated Cys-rich membrane protein [Clostridia bacterium]MBQ4603473.1 FeoB-associated Cys-rich membrane protein [Clostridia bacterium]
MDFATFLVTAIIAVVFFAIIFFSARNRKKGKGSCACSGGCSGCKGGCEFNKK